MWPLGDGTAVDSHTPKSIWAAHTELDGLFFNEDIKLVRQGRGVDIVGVGEGNT